jgi:hypothetical protein
MLSGKDIWEAYREYSQGASQPWDVASERVQDIYNAVADKLNAQLSKAGEAERPVYSAADIALVLPHIAKGLKRIAAHPEQEYAEEMATSYLTDVLDLISNILPDDIRPLVRQILALYEQATKEE